MDLNTRISLLHRLGEWIDINDGTWQAAKERADRANPWFTPDQVEMAVLNIRTAFLDENKLTTWLSGYTLPGSPKIVGIVMAGNIPLVGFHDFVCGFISGHMLRLKLSSKDEILLTALLNKLAEWQPEVQEQVQIQEMLKNCDAYIATGSNNTSRYFEQYFARFPHIIRRNRTSVAILDGTESNEELEDLADDVFVYYGLGCRNVTQVCVPEGYDFVPMINAFKKYSHLTDQHKYKNNYDYHLAIYLLNQVPYMSNEAVLLVENEMPFSAVSVLHYRYYNNHEVIAAVLSSSPDIQVIIGHGFTPFGKAQTPALSDYADGVDTMGFLCSI